MPKLPLAFALFAALAAPAAAHADTYNFAISTSQSTMGSPATTFVASGTLTGTARTGPPAAIDLTGVTGSAQGYDFTGVAPLSTSTSFAFDNIVYTDPTANHVDASGVLLFLNSPIGTSLAHVYFSKNGYQVDVFDPRDPADTTPFAIDSFTVTPTAVPEPSTLALLGTGALGLFGTLRRKLAA